MRKTIVAIALFLLASQNLLLAQNSRSGKIGIGYSSIFATKTNDFALSFWLSDDFLLEPQFGFQHLDVAENKGTSWRFGIGGLVALNNSTVIPYFGGRIKTIIISGDEKVYSDLVLSLVFGGEYFMSEWFSISAEMRLNYISTDDELSPTYLIADASIIETEEVLNLKLYFK